MVAESKKRMKKESKRGKRNRCETQRNKRE